MPTGSVIVVSSGPEPVAGLAASQARSLEKGKAAGREDGHGAQRSAGQRPGGRRNRPGLRGRGSVQGDRPAAGNGMPVRLPAGRADEAGQRRLSRRTRLSPPYADVSSSLLLTPICRNQSSCRALVRTMTPVMLRTPIVSLGPHQPNAANVRRKSREDRKEVTGERQASRFEMAVPAVWA